MKTRVLVDFKGERLMYLSDAIAFVENVVLGEDPTNQRALFTLRAWKAMQELEGKP